MNNNSAQQLSEKLKQKHQQDRKQVEDLIQNELTQLTQNFNTQLNDALNTTLSAIRQNLQSVSNQAQQLQADYQDQKEEGQNRLRNYMMVSGLFHFLSVGALILSLVWFHNSLDARIPPAVQITQQERQQLDALRRYNIQITHNSMGTGFLLFPDGAQEPKAFRSPSFPDQWLLRLETNPFSQQR